MKLFAKGKGPVMPAAGKAPAFKPIDRANLLGLLNQVVNGGQSGVLELHEPRGAWVYAFQAGALTHAGGGRVRGARQAFDLLWEFQYGEFQFTPGTNPALSNNLYIDRGRLQEMLQRSQAVLQTPGSPYIPPDQQRPIAPVHPGYAPPPGYPAGYGQAPQGAPPQAYPQQAYPAQPYPQQQQPYPQPQPPYPQQQQQQYPQAPYPQQPGYPGAPQAQPPRGPAPFPRPQVGPAVPQPPVNTPQRAATPSFSVPPMAIPRRREATPTYQPVPAPPQPPAPVQPLPPQPAAPVDDLKALRASLVAQAPAAGRPAAPPAWNARTPQGAMMPPPAPRAGQKPAKDGRQGPKRNSALREAVSVQLIKFLLWACERRYSPEDHWTLKDAFEVSTMELKDQFVGAFSQSFKASPKAGGVREDDVDDMTAGRMRGRAKPRKR